jgi:DNA invertase Pin-like site-specific DNA recombinase
MNIQPAVLYLRSATQEGKEDNALELQEQMLTDFAQQLGYTVTDVYKDFGSGNDPNRAGLQKLLADAKAGHFKTLIMRDYARLARDHALFQRIEQALSKNTLAILTPKTIFYR